MKQKRRKEIVDRLWPVPRVYVSCNCCKTRHELPRTGGGFYHIKCSNASCPNVGNTLAIGPG